MKKINISTSAVVYENLSELSQEDSSLLAEALKATHNSYAPYSKFRVGAALLLENGKVLRGSNQENAAYPSGMCAERVVIWQAGASYPGVKIKKIAITATSKSIKVDKPVGPCGACRQTMLEYEVNQEEPIEIIFMGETGKIVKTESVVSLLPFSFDASYL